MNTSGFNSKSILCHMIEVTYIMKLLSPWKWVSFQIHLLELHVLLLKARCQYTHNQFDITAHYRICSVPLEIN